MKNLNKNFYDKEALDFFYRTYNLDLTNLYKKFLPYVKKDETILDIGAGSGRDSKYFSDNGYKYVAIDVSTKLAQIAKDVLDITIIEKSILDISYSHEFGGIWACASLLHLNNNELEQALYKIAKAAKKNSYVYLSFKYGDFSGVRDQRYFNDMTMEKFNTINHSNLIVVESWITSDASKRDVKWLNIILKKFLKFDQKK